MMYVDRVLVLVPCVLLLEVHGYHLGIDDNEVIKSDVINKPPPKVAPDILEAFYYETYADVLPGFDPHEGRPGNATLTNSCDLVGPVPPELQDARYMRPYGLSHWYTKYAEAYGIPVLASLTVPDAAVRRACYVLRFLLADRADLRQQYYKAYGRVAIVPKFGQLTDIPEYYFVPSVYNTWTRGLGAVPLAPVSTAGEENILCLHDGDIHKHEDILLRQIAQGIVHLAARYLDPDFDAELEHLYQSAVASRWWADSYAVHTKEAYLGEGIQSFFNANAYAAPPNGVANQINTRNKLRTYDSRLYNMIHSLFPCSNFYIKRCSSRGNEQYQDLRMDCPDSIWMTRQLRRELRREHKLKVRKHRTKSRSQQKDRRSRS